VKRFVIVPVRDQWEHTRAFLASLDADEVDYCLVMDNGSTDETATRIREWQHAHRSHYAAYYPLGPKLHRASMPDLLIYDMWNEGFARCKRLAKGDSFTVLVSNNDVVLPHGALAGLSSALAVPGVWVSYPDYEAPWHDYTQGPYSLRRTRGVLSDGGMFGACFMLAGERIPWQPLVSDTGYYWWYGDNHLAEQIEHAGGQQVRVEGLPIHHIHEATAREWPHVEAWKYHDRQRWVTRHQRWEPA
jgi:GT2 family glycosyltransferase